MCIENVQKKCGTCTVTVNGVLEGVGVPSSSDLFRTSEFLNKISQVAEEALVMMINKAQEKVKKIQKLEVLCFLLTSAKAKKFQDGDRSTRLYNAISLQLRGFSKIATNFYQKYSCSFQQWVQQEAKRSYL